MDLQKQDKPEMSEDKWTEDFLKQTADQFEKNLQNLLQNGKLLRDAQRRKIMYYYNCY